MDAKKKAALEQAGWRFGDTADFLDLSAEERQALEESCGELLTSAPDGKDAEPPEARGTAGPSPFVE